jgi:methionyl-tRNA formyltransferase
MQKCYICYSQGRAAAAAVPVHRLRLLSLSVPQGRLGADKRRLWENTRQEGLGSAKSELSRTGIYQQAYLKPTRSWADGRQIRGGPWRTAATQAWARGDGPTVCSSASGRPSHKKVVFLGTPEVASRVLVDLIHASRESLSNPNCSHPWEISAVVTQPGRPKGRGKVPQPSPVYSTAVELGIPESMILCPAKASEEDFLLQLEALKPDICITAAYGNYLPTAFLRIPAQGTLNIHPSLLPLYRGAAPVQRSLEDGVKETGVSVLFTVKQMDAGPVVWQTKYTVPDNMTSPELLDVLFSLGTKSLVEECLPRVWDGSVEDLLKEQDEDKATHAAKIGRGEGLLSFEAAQREHNKVRAFYGWPGTYHRFKIMKEGDHCGDDVEVKILETRVGDPLATEGLWEAGEETRVVYDSKAHAMMVRCQDGSVLEIVKLQNQGKKPVDAKSFQNGLVGKKMYWTPM